MKGLKFAVALAASLPLGACATVIEGTSQSVTLNTNPPGAECHLTREGKEIGAIAQSPGSVRIDKSKNDITATCTKDGYQQTAVTTSPKFVGTTFGNIVLGGVVGAVVDASSGANYSYPDAIQVVMTPASPPVAAAPVASTAPQVIPASASAEAPPVSPTGTPPESDKKVRKSPLVGH